MNILLTGGTGDLGNSLTTTLINKGDIVHRVDISPPKDSLGIFHQVSILDREKLIPLMKNIDVVVHIAAWHGIHEFREEHNTYEFWDLNVTGTLNVLELAYQSGIKNVVNISSSSVDEKNSFYGETKRLSENIANFYFENRDMNIVSLRPRAFIPYTNSYAYSSFVEWSQWFWKGAVHIDDVNQAVTLAIDLLNNEKLSKHHALMVDGAYEYTSDDIENWDSDGNGTTFRKYYNKYYDLVIQNGLDPSVPPTIEDISQTTEILGYQPKYSLINMLQELEKNS